MRNDPSTMRPQNASEFSIKSVDDPFPRGLFIESDKDLRDLRGSDILLDAPAPLPQLTPIENLGTASSQEVLKIDAAKALMSPPEISPHPPLLPEFHFLDFLNRFNDSMRNYTGILLDELGSKETELKSCLAELSERLKESAQKMNESTFWTVLWKIASFLGSFLTLITGGVLLAGSHGFVGGALLASGILAIGNTILTQADGWKQVAEIIAGDDEKRKKELAIYLPGVVGAASAILGLSGGIGAAMVQAPIPNPILFVTSAIEAFTGVTGVAKGVMDYRVNRAEVAVQEAHVLREWLESLQDVTSHTLKTQEDGKHQIFSLSTDILRTITEANQAAIYV